MRIETKRYVSPFAASGTTTSAKTPEFRIALTIGPPRHPVLFQSCPGRGPGGSLIGTTSFTLTAVIEADRQSQQ